MLTQEKIELTTRTNKNLQWLGHHQHLKPCQYRSVQYDLCILTPILTEKSEKSLATILTQLPSHAACCLGPVSAQQRNALQMVLHWWADSDPLLYMFTGSPMSRRVFIHRTAFFGFYYGPVYFLTTTMQE